MKTLRYLPVIFIMLFAFSCELLDDVTGLSVAERLEGRWMVEEEDHLKSTEDAYQVYIDISPVDSNTIVLDNFYGAGWGTSAYANIIGMAIEMPSQNVGGFTVRGTATISANFKQMTWHYFVDDGSGIWMEVNAVYTKEESY